FRDDGAGMAVEEWDAAWTTLSDYRGVNANMHGVEAMLADADALETVADDMAGAAGDLRAHALRTTERDVHGWARERDWRLRVYRPARCLLPGPDAAVRRLVRSGECRRRAGLTEAAAGGRSSSRSPSSLAATSGSGRPAPPTPAGSPASTA